MRLPRALNLNENPAQFGIFFSANRLRHPTGNNLPTLLAYLSQILVRLLCCNDSYLARPRLRPTRHDPVLVKRP
uniref:Uncharacterized protein n=1 Tax=Candidatus Kentrum sp. FM TaxID=2126340 RepID=A0A450TZP2_9GAMM|nr:MAG: hypothetical protein BECKFM1743A_GA0114220_108441 [Candidatus Kentron sp. FM]